MAKESDFATAMLSFIRWYFLTLDPAFTESVTAGKPLEQAAEEVFASITATVRGNRHMSRTLSGADFGAIMDQIAALHLRTRHGETVVSNELVPL